MSDEIIADVMEPIEIVEVVIQEAADGDTGPPGAAGTITIGTVTTGAPGSAVSFVNVGTANAAIFNISIPAGATGATGNAGTITIGTVTTGAAGSAASVVNVGSAIAAILNISIPAGATGATGNAATISIGTVTTGAPGSAVSIVNVGTANAAILNISIPAGATGATGNSGTIAIGTVTTGAAGSAASVTNVGTANAAIFNFSIPRGAAAVIDDPEMIRGLQLKLAADDLQYQGLTAIANNDAIAAWRAPNKPNAITAEIVFSQATVGARPIYRTNIQNSLPGVFFDGSNDVMTANAALMSILGNNARTVFVVCQPTAVASGGAGSTWNRPQVYSNAGQFNGISVSPSGPNNIITAWDYDTTGVIKNVATAAVAPNTTVLLTHKHEKGVSSLSLNQGTPVTTSILRDCTNATIMQLGSNGAGSGFYQGFIFEILMYARVLTATETASVEGYLKAKWNV